MTVSKQQVRSLRESGLLDEQWYLSRYPDVVELGIGAAEHYLRIGARLLRNPGPEFDTAYYLFAHQDVARSGQNPLVHYIRHGRREGRSCVQPGTASATGRLQAEVIGPGRAPHRVVHEGLRPRNPASRTVMVCAHVAGQRMFGGERSLLDIVEGLSSLGHNVVVTVPGMGHPEYIQALRERSLAVLSLDYGWWRRLVPVDDKAVASLAQVIADYAVDAVHVNTIMLREPLLAARRMGVPAIVHAREIITHDVALCELIGEEPQAIVEKVMEGADWIIANSRATADCFSKRDCTRVVPNTVDVAAFDIGPPSLTDGVRIAMVSSNMPKKGLQDFVEVARLMQGRVGNARFVLVGPENQHTAELKQRQESGELPGNIVFAGYRASAVEAMREADIVLNLSHFQESFGRTVLEAMAARRPVVAYAWGAVPELVRDGETGFIVPFRDMAAVAARLEELCAQPDLIKAMGEAGHRVALERFDRGHYAKSLEAAYEAIFDRAASEPAAPLVLPARDEACVNPQGQLLRIAYFLWHFPVPSETFVLNELRMLVEQGHDVRVYCRQSPHKGFKPDFPIEWTQVESPEELSRQLLHAGRNIVHSHFTYPTVTEMVWPACELAGIPFTFIAHAQDIFRHSNDEKNRIGEIGRSPLCLRVLVPSRYHRDFVESRGVPAAKLLINPNGIDPELYAAARDPKRARREKRSICAIHRFAEKKGLDRLISAGRALSEDGIQIHVYGYGELEREYRELIASLALDNVHLHGPIGSRAEMLEVFQRHDLFACPSIRARDGDMDGIPTVLMEAMASGVPVLATAISGIPDLVKDEVTGIVCEATEESIVDAVRRFYAMPEGQVQAIVDDGLALIRRDFDVVALASVLLRLWRQQTIDVLIVSWNNLPQLREVVSRLQKFTQMPFHLLICDNGSSPDVLAYLCRIHAEHDNTTVILNRQNAYVGPGTNLCLERGSSDYAVYVCGKEGFVLDYGWEKRLVRFMDAHPKVGLAGTQCYSPSYLTGARYPEAIPLFAKFRNQEFATANPDRRFSHVQGGFFVIRRAMYGEIGGFSDEVPHSYTDVEYSFYAESRGWELGTAPGLLALFNKTRPGLFSRIDESVAAAHPPRLEDLPLLDRIAQVQAAHCNLCGWHDDAFAIVEDAPTCPDCGSRPADRSLYRYLAESMLTHRRLPALAVNVGRAMEAIWKQQFQGKMLSGQALRQSLAERGTLEFNAGTLKLVYVDDALDDEAGDSILAEVDRLLAPDGLFLFTLPRHGARPVGEITRACRLHAVEPVRFSSRVVRYDSRPLYLGRRAQVARCVS